jgi:hypothetical protein
MPEYIRALVVILFISTIVFAFARKPASEIIQTSDFIRRRNLWITFTLAAFLAQNIWLCFLITTVLILFTKSRETNPTALYFLLLFILPPVAFQRILDFTMRIPTVSAAKKTTHRDLNGKALKVTICEPIVQIVRKLIPAVNILRGRVAELPRQSLVIASCIVVIVCKCECVLGYECREK